MLIVEEKDFKKLEELGFEEEVDDKTYDKKLCNTDWVKISVYKNNGKIVLSFSSQVEDLYDDELEELYDFLSLDTVKKV